jgi:branched-chain amino acid transport system substrate-binding protein
MKARSILTIFVLVFLVSAFPAFSDERTGITDDTIQLGLIGPMTGPLTFAGSPIKNGGMMLFDEVNGAGGINGRKLEIIVGDTQHLPSVSSATIKKLIERDQVFALWGGAGTNAILPVLPMIKEAKIPFLDVFVSHPSLTSPVHKYLFRAGSVPLDVVARHMVEHAHREFRPGSVAMIHTSGEYGKFGAEKLEANLSRQGTTIVGKETFNSGDVDFTSQVARLRKADPDVIFLVSYPKEAAIILRQAKELGVRGKWVGADALSDRSFALLVGDVGAGFQAVWSWGPYLETSTHPEVVGFIKKYREKYPGAPAGRPNIYDMVCYASAKVLVEGLKNAGRDLTRESLVKGIESAKNFDSIFLGEINMSATDHQGNKVSRITKFGAGGERTLLEVTYE